VSAVRRRRLDAGAAVLTLLVILTGLRWNTRVAAAADAYGYVSQVDLWLRGNLHIDQSFAASVPWPNPRWSFAPLGYVPAPASQEIVPQYPAGLSLLMAAARVAFGYCAMFWVVPFCGGALVLATYAIGCRIDRPAVGLAAAWLVATSPAMLFMMMAPMSDVPAAAAWAIAIAGALGGTVVSAGAAGAAAAVAILIRPNLIPLAGIIAVWLATRGAMKMLAFGALASIGAIAVGAINARLYGSALRSGYDLTDGFAIAYVWPNIQRYGGWLFSAETPLPLAGLVALAVPSAALWRTDGARRAHWMFAAAAAAVWIFYLVYVPWDAWWYLRFLLPAWPLMAIGAAALAAIAARSGRWQQIVVAAAIAGVGIHGLVEAKRRAAFDVARGEAKYVDVARVVDAVTDPDAVIISAVHSGSLRYYAGRLTLRWDTGDPAWLDRTAEWLAARGHHPYFVLEPQEIAELRTRFGQRSMLARLDWTPMVVFPVGGVQLFDAVRRERGGTPVEQPSKGAIRECIEQKPPPQLQRIR
jgi:hypothetical protein